MSRTVWSKSYDCSVNYDSSMAAIVVSDLRLKVEKLFYVVYRVILLHNILSQKT